MSKIGVMLSGCGVYDGSEIHEAVLTLLSLDRRGFEIVCMAPDIDMMHVIDHCTGDVTGESRNVLIESARIARGNIKDAREVSKDDIDALIFPGGFGAAKNLCNFATNGTECVIQKDVERLIRDMHRAGKPMGFVCIAPVIISKVLGKVSVTIGNDEDVSSKLKLLGSNHVECSVKEFVVDKENKIVSSPAYMLGQRITEVSEGIDKTVDALMGLLKN